MVLLPLWHCGTLEGAEKKLKGGAIIGYLQFVKKKWGNAGYEQCLKDTGIDPSRLKTQQLYDREISDRVLNWIRTNKGDENVTQCGKFTVKNLGPLGYLVRFMNIETMLKKAEGSYREAFKYGKMKSYVDLPNKTALIRLIDSTEREVSCLAWHGVFEGILEMRGLKGTVTKTKCQLKGDQYCEYKMKWN